MGFRSRQFWIPILIGIPLSLLANILSDNFSTKTVIGLFVVTLLTLLVYAFWEKIRLWFINRNRLRRKKEAERLKKELEDIDNLKNNTSMLLSRIAIDLTTLLFFGLIVIILSNTFLVIQSLPSTISDSEMSDLWIVFLPFVLNSICYVSLVVMMITFSKSEYLYKILKHTEYSSKTKRRIGELLREDDNRLLVINSATYGANQNVVDVLELVRSKVNSNTLDILVENSLFGEPALGQKKVLTMEYSIRGETKRCVMPEGERILINANE